MKNNSIKTLLKFSQHSDRYNSYPFRYLFGIHHLIQSNATYVIVSSSDKVK